MVAPAARQRQRGAGVSGALKLWTPREVGARLGMSASWVKDHSNGRRRPRLPAIRVGGVWRYIPEDIERWIESLKQQSEDADASS